MTYRWLIFTLPLSIPLVLAPACGGDDEKIDADAAVEPTPDSSLPPEIDASPPTADAGAAPDATPCVNIVGIAREPDPDPKMDPPGPGPVPLPDLAITARVGSTVVDSTTTQPDGNWAVCVPAGSEVALAFEKNGYSNLQLLLLADVDQYLDMLIFTDAFVEPLWTDVGGTYPTTTSGFISIDARDSLGMPLDGVSGSIVPPSTLGARYVDESFAYDMNLDATSTAGFFVFPNVEEGEVDLTLDHPTLTCRHEENGFMTAPEVLRIPVWNDVETAVRVICE